MKTSDCWREAYSLVKTGEVGRAMELCAKAPCDESIECQYFLGGEYLERKELESAIHWYTRAAEKGDQRALYGLGCVHVITKKYPQALQYFERAAGESIPAAYYRIGSFYGTGCGIPKDIEKAIQYFQKGAALGHFGCKQCLIAYKLQSRSLLERFLARCEHVGVTTRIAVTATFNVDDPRLLGIPGLDVFRKKRA